MVDTKGVICYYYQHATGKKRITYEGTFHHLMNRGIIGEDIFPVNTDKNQFLDFLAETSQKIKIPVYAYCIMTNHYQGRYRRKIF